MCSRLSGSAVGVYFVTPCLIEQISTLLKGHQLYQTEVAEGFIIRFELALNKTNLERIQSSLDELNKKEKKTFDKEDEDIKELKEYLSAKIDSLK